MSNRMDKINNLIRQELAPVLERYTQEIGGIVTITYVITSPDLGNADIGISCFQTGSDGEEVQKILNQNARLFHQEISQRLHLRRIPILHFKLDVSGQYAQHMDSLFNQIKEERAALKPEEDDQ